MSLYFNKQQSQLDVNSTKIEKKYCNPDLCKPLRNIKFI